MAYCTLINKKSFSCFFVHNKQPDALSGFYDKMRHPAEELVALKVEVKNNLNEEKRLALWIHGPGDLNSIDDKSKLWHAVRKSKLVYNVIEIVILIDDLSDYNTKDKLEIIQGWNLFERIVTDLPNVDKAVFVIRQIENDANDRIQAAGMLIEKLASILRQQLIGGVGLVNTKYPINISKHFPSAGTLFLGSIDAQHLKSIECGSKIDQIIVYHCKRVQLDQLNHPWSNIADNNLIVRLYSNENKVFLAAYTQLKSSAVAPLYTSLCYVYEDYEFTYSKLANHATSENVRNLQSKLGLEAIGSISIDQKIVSTLNVKQFEAEQCDHLKELLKRIENIDRPQLDFGEGAGSGDDTASDDNVVVDIGDNDVTKGNICDNDKSGDDIAKVAESSKKSLKKISKKSFWRNLGRLLLEMNFPIIIQFSKKTNTGITRMDEIKHEPGKFVGEFNTGYYYKLSYVESEAVRLTFANIANNTRNKFTEDICKLDVTSLELYGKSRKMFGIIYEYMKTHLRVKKVPIWPNMRTCLVAYRPERVNINDIFAGRENILEAFGFCVKDYKIDYSSKWKFLEGRNIKFTYDAEQKIIWCRRAGSVEGETDYEADDEEEKKEKEEKEEEEEKEDEEEEDEQEKQQTEKLKKKEKNVKNEREADDREEEEDLKQEKEVTEAVCEEVENEK